MSVSTEQIQLSYLRREHPERSVVIYRWGSEIYSGDKRTAARMVFELNGVSEGGANWIIHSFDAY